MQIFHETVQLFAALKKKIIRYNNKTAMTKSLRKTIMTRSKHELNKTKTGDQKIGLLKKTKKQMGTS